MDEFINQLGEHISAWVHENPNTTGILIGAVIAIAWSFRHARGHHECDDGEIKPLEPIEPIQPIRSSEAREPHPRTKRAHQAARPAPRTDPPAAALRTAPRKPPLSLGKQWARADRRYKKLCEEYAAFECDPYELIRLPVLADVSFETTAAFIEAFHKARQLATEAQPPDEYIPAFVAAVDKAVAAWQGARAYAEHVHASQFTAEQRTLLRRIQSALTLADNASGEHEQRAALSRAGLLMRQLEKVCSRTGREWRVPKAARAQIETWIAFGQITAAEPSADLDGHGTGTQPEE